MKALIFITCLFLGSADAINLCSPARPITSEMVSDKESYIFLKGYFLPHDGSATQLAKFRVIQSSDSSYVEGDTYGVYSYGPYGSECESYEMGESPLEDEFCGKDNLRYLFSYKNIDDCNRIVTPIFHGHGLTINIKEDVVSDDYKEYTSLIAFEKYLMQAGNIAPKWTKIPKE